jgi:uncharacterized membrane protein YgcG
MGGVLDVLFGHVRTPEEQMALARECLQDMCRDLAREAGKADKEAQANRVHAKNALRSGNAAGAQQFVRFVIDAEQHAIRYRSMRNQLQKQAAGMTLQQSQLGMQTALTQSTRAMCRALSSLPPAMFAMTLQQHSAVSMMLAARQEEMVAGVQDATDLADEALDDEVGEAPGAADPEAARASLLDQLGAELELADAEQMPARHPTSAPARVSNTAHRGGRGGRGGGGGSSSGGRGKSRADVDAEADALLAALDKGHA